MRREENRWSSPDTQSLEYQKDLIQVKASPAYKTVANIVKVGLKSQFIYHYAEEKRWLLGSGSYGEVYICFFEEVTTNKVLKFALKSIQIPSNISEVKKIEDTVETTRQEIKSLIKLRQNQNIIKIQDVIGDRDHRRIYLVLEYCNNKDLESYFEQQRRAGRLKGEEDVLAYFKQLLNAFEDLYKHNIIHRDIKPANIFVHNRILKIGDFGLSQQLFEKKENLQEHRMIGTLLTSAPQLIFKEPYTNKCDIYSLGLCLYWMLFQKFPFTNINCFDKQQLLKESLSFENDPTLKCSTQLGRLLKLMLAYKEDDRIDWRDLFSHPLFQNLKAFDPPRIRDTIGRNLQGVSLSMMLESTIPIEFYQYIGEDYEIDMMSLLGGQKGASLSFRTVVMQGINFNFKVAFLRMTLKEVHETGHEEKIKNKIQFSIVKDLLRLGIQTYIHFLNKAFLNQLNGASNLHLLDLAALRQISNSKHYRSYVQKFAFDTETYENSHKKPKLSKDQHQKLDRDCKTYEVRDQFQLILAGQLLVKDEQQFLDQVKRCIIELIYFVKEQIRYYAHQIGNLTEGQLKRYRQLVLLIHHLNMFILLPSIFPKHYDPELEYDFQKFQQNEKYAGNHAFRNLARQINDVIAKFQN